MEGIQFTITIKTLAGLKWQLPYSSLSMSDEKNKDRLANFTVEIDAGEVVAANTGVTLEFILSGGYRELDVHDHNGVLVYSGFIDETVGSAGGGEVGSLAVSSKGFFYLFEKRFTSSLQTYTGVDAGDIAWDLINTTQAKPYGDFGITLGLIEASKDRDRTYKWRNIKDAIEQLTSDNVKEGFDFDIDVNKEFNVFYPSKGEVRNDIVFDSSFNIDNWQVRKTGILSMCNHAIIFGEGNGDSMVVVEEDSDNSYKDAFFLLEEGLSDKDNGDVDLLTDKALAYLERYQAPEKNPINFTCFYNSPLYTNYNVGDMVHVIIAEMGVDEMMRIYKKSVDMSGKVSVTVRLT